MKNTSTFIGIGLLIAITALSGYVQGKLNNRWGVPEDRLKAAERVKQLPTEFGDWRLESTEKLNPFAYNVLECGEDYLQGRYLNQVTRESVSVFIVLGAPGPISVHTPEVCYSSRHYDVHEPTKLTKISDELPDEFWTVTMRKKDVFADLQRVFWAWGDTDHWRASQRPRFEFGGGPYLFKIQLSAEMRPDTDLEKNDTCKNFLNAFLPVANPILFGKHSAAETQSTSARE